MYEVVLSIQMVALLFVACFFKLWERKDRPFLLAGMLFITPVPIVRLTAGVGGFVYFGDLIALCCAFRLVQLRWSHGVSSSLVVQARRVVFLLFLVFPFIGLALSLLNGASGDIRSVFLGLVRGALYLSVFWYCSAHVHLEWNTVVKAIRIQLVLLLIYCLIGIGQYFIGYNVDYWNDVRALDGLLSEEGYGGGFMGLYRGAVGAWVAVLLSLSSAAFLSQRSGRFVTHVSFAVVVLIGLAGTLIVGSRQGLFFGLFGCVFGALCLYHYGYDKDVRGSVVKGAVYTVFAVAAAIALAYVFLAESDLMEWFVVRFGSVFGGEGVVDEVANRDPRFNIVVERLLSSPLMYVFGVGEMAMVPEGAGGEYGLMYVDSEFLWTFQKIGAVGLLCYLMFFMRCAQILLGVGVKLDVSRYDRSRAAILGLPVLAVCVLLIYGHYSLLHVQSSQAPVAYTAWLSLGVAFSFLNRKRGYILARRVA